MWVIALVGLATSLLPMVSLCVNLSYGIFIQVLFYCPLWLPWVCLVLLYTPSVYGFRSCCMGIVAMVFVVVLYMAMQEWVASVCGSLVVLVTPALVPLVLLMLLFCDFFYLTDPSIPTGMYS